MTLITISLNSNNSKGTRNPQPVSTISIARGSRVSVLVNDTNIKNIIG
ncbi:hypothetical protein FQV37_1875 [Psychrobacter nivimaris]|uniref:Uncharacterized protein n=1 Tax=Psychrobacter nivimaris TaxID=281738 RepID=A0A6N7BYZ8_9GAMM|nr:hypothetical protein FQV37_1875 [Psychrobacter nivimaris]